MKLYQPLTIAALLFLTNTSFAYFNQIPEAFNCQSLTDETVVEVKKINNLRPGILTNIVVTNSAGTESSHGFHPYYSPDPLDLTWHKNGIKNHFKIIKEEELLFAHCPVHSRAPCHSDKIETLITYKGFLTVNGNTTEFLCSHASKELQKPSDLSPSL